MGNIRRSMLGAALLAAGVIATAAQYLPPTQSHDRIEFVGRYYVTGVARHSSIGRQVWIDYVASSSGPTDARIASDSVARTVDFVPTATAVLDPRLVAVGGHAAGDPQSTRIELWSLAEPTVLLATDPASGARSHTMSGAAITQASVVHQTSAAGRRGVRRMIRLRGRPTSLLVQFEDSGDLYELDWGVTPAAATVRLAASESGMGVPVVPQLANRSLDATHGRRHSSAGFIYLFMPQMRAGEPLDAQQAALALVDADYDGTIDSAQMVGVGQLQAWKASGYTEMDLCAKW